MAKKRKYAIRYMPSARKKEIWQISGDLPLLEKLERKTKKKKDLHKFIVYINNRSMQHMCRRKLFLGYSIWSTPNWYIKPNEDSLFSLHCFFFFSSFQIH